MEPEDPGDLLGRAEAVLEQYFLAQEDGRGIDLDEICAGDRELRQLVDRLVQHDEQIGAMFVADATAEPLETLLPALRAVGLSSPEMGDFRILRLLGSGGMGTVFLALQGTLNRPVALKVLRSAVVPDNVSLLRFRREAEVASSLRDPHIAEIYAVGEQDGRAYIAMQLLGGPSLAEVDLPMAPAEVLKIGRAIAGALSAAHMAGVVHRDVKPANILLEGGEPYLVDFGLARSQTDTTLTREGNVLGTLPYVAPEFLQGDQPRLDPRADIYGLGATLYELLAGKPPFSGNHPLQILRQIMLKEPARLHLSGSFRDLEMLILRCLEKEPSRRIASARFLEQELLAVEQGRPIESRPTGSLERARRLATRHRGVTIAGALGLALALPLAGALFASWSNQRSARSASLVMAREARERGELSEALAVLTPLRGDGEDRELEELARDLDGRLVLSEVLEAALGRYTTMDETYVLGRLERLEATGGRASDPAHAAAAVALLRWFLGERERARIELELAERHEVSPRLLAALEGLLSEHPPADGLPVELPVDASADPTARALIATAMRFQRTPVEQQIEELQSALARESDHSLARLALALTYYFHGRPARAIDILEGLAGEGQRPVARAYLLHAKLRKGDLAGARRLLSERPEAEWGPGEMLVDLHCLAQQRSLEEVEERLEVHRRRLSQARQTPSSGMLLFEAQLAYSALGEWERAEALMEEAAEGARDSLALEYVEAARFRMRADRAFEELPDSVRERNAHLAALVEAGDELLTRLRLREPIGIVQWKLGRARILSDLVASGFEQLEASVELLPHRSEPVIVFCDLALDFAQAFATRPDDDGFPVGLSRHLARRAWWTSRRMLEQLEARELELPEVTRAVLFRSYWKAARMARDWSGMARRIDEYWVSLEAEETDAYLEEADEALRLLESYYEQ